MNLAEHMDELRWWADLRGGQKEALSKIYHQHIRLLINYGRKFSKNDQLVEDAIHDLFVELWQRHDRLGETDSVARYLLGSLRRKIIRQEQRNKKHIQQDLDPDLYNFQISLDIEQLIVQDESNSQQSARLKEALGKLSARQREAIYLRYQSELDYEQVAQIMDINYQSARNLIHQAIKSLRKSLISILLPLFLNLQRIFFDIL